MAMRKGFGRSNGNTQAKDVSLPNVTRVRVALRLKGTSPLLCHRFEEKAITEMLTKQIGIPYERGKKHPKGQFEGGKYLNTKGEDCLPTSAIRKAMVEAATFSDDMTKKLALGAFYFIGEYAPLKFDRCEMRTDVCRTSGLGRVPDIRFRPEYHDWSADVVVDFNSRMITIDQLLYLVREAGTAIGLLEWRAQKAGSHGMFEVDPLPDSDIARVVKACSVPRRPLELPEWLVKEFDRKGENIAQATSEVLNKARRQGPKKNGTSPNPFLVPNAAGGDAE